MVSIGISEFRANMNEVLQKVQQGEIVILTLRGEEIARLVPPEFAKLAALQELEKLRKTAVIGDLLNPLDVVWESDQ